MPNSYDVHVGVFDEHLQLIVDARYPRMLTIARHENNVEMGCSWIVDSNQRGLLCSRASWSVSSMNTT
jgi:hypothetical protein